MGDKDLDSPAFLQLGNPVLHRVLDQRENRAEVEKLSRGKKVLNAFSFSGGFSVYAARGGAKSVTN